MLVFKEVDLEKNGEREREGKKWRGTERKGEIRYEHRSRSNIRIKNEPYKKSLYGR